MKKLIAALILAAIACGGCTAPWQYPTFDEAVTLQSGDVSGKNVQIVRSCDGEPQQLCIRFLLSPDQFNELVKLSGFSDDDIVSDGNSRSILIGQHTANSIPDVEMLKFLGEQVEKAKLDGLTDVVIWATLPA